jgi:xanthine dehydrogenase iron-sulfur cluster and FAD-binding subunit A
LSVVIPRTLQDALVATAANPTAQIIQGGTDLMVEINFNHRKPTDVIALRRVEELRGFVFNAQQTQITIGAGLPYQQMVKLLERYLRSHRPQEQLAHLRFAPPARSVET